MSSLFCKLLPMSYSVTFIFLFLCSCLYSQNFVLKIDYPVPLNITNGIVSTHFHYNLPFKHRRSSVSIGTSYTFLKFEENQNLMNYTLDLGLQKAIRFSSTLTAVPYLNSGYSLFNYNKTVNNGATGEVGLYLSHERIKHLAVHFAYRQYLMNHFVFPQENTTLSGQFGMVLIGFVVQ